MTPKERAAMQQALEALEKAPYPVFHKDIVNQKQAITALREALAVSEQRTKEQAEQEPIRFVWNGEGWIEADEYLWKTTPDAERRELYAAPQPDMNLNCKSVQKRLATVWGYVKAEQAEQEPVACDEHCKYDDGICMKHHYAAPVRTKDLTDEELWEAAKTAKSNDLTDAFRAVIAAHKEKNK